MIVGLGVDIVEIQRFKRARERWGRDFLEKVFTKNEISYSNKRRFLDQHLAARYATKEAVFKAFGNIGSIRKWTDIEVLNDKNGRPYVLFHGSASELKKVKSIEDVIVSMSHSRGHAVANAVLISK